LRLGRGEGGKGAEEGRGREGMGRPADAEKAAVRAASAFLICCW